MCERYIDVENHSKNTIVARLVVKMSTQVCFHMFAFNIYSRKSDNTSCETICNNNFLRQRNEHT